MCTKRKLKDCSLWLSTKLKIDKIPVTNLKRWITRNNILRDKSGFPKSGHIYLSVHLLTACLSVWVFTQIYMYIYIYLCIHTHCMHDSPYLVIPGTAPTVHALLLFKLLMRLLFPTLGRPATMSTQHRYNVPVRTTYLQILYEPLVQCL